MQFMTLMRCVCVCVSVAATERVYLSLSADPQKAYIHPHISHFTALLPTASHLLASRLQSEDSWKVDPRYTKDCC